MNKITITCIAIFVIEMVVLTCVSFYVLALFNQVRASIIAKAVTGVDLVLPVFSSMIDAWATR